MKVHLLIHSTVMIELEKYILLFDAYTLPLPKFKQDKQIICFFSHHHLDHYHPDIISHLPASAFVILADDIPFNSRENQIIMSAHQTYQQQDIQISTLKSNDEGVAYIVQCEDQLIYHAGDLNDWIWGDEENPILHQQYLDELQHIQGMTFDLACIPFDQRLGQHQQDGLETFLEYAKAKHILPIHSWQQYDHIQAYHQTHPQIPLLDVANNNLTFAF